MTETAPDSTPAEREAPADLEAARERSLQEDLRLLADDARVLAQAELAYQKSRAAFAGQEAGRIALLGVLAAVLVFFALMALTLGVVLALTPVLGAWGATAAATGGLLLVAAILGMIVASRVRHMKATLTDGKGK